MTTLLDLNDAALTVWRDDDAHLSPGYVRLDGDLYDFGLGAQAVARRFPRDISTRYWSQLNLQPLAPPLGHARHSADLVHGHLSQLLAGVSGDVMLAVPGHLSREQLSLLLGVMGTLPGEVTTLVHRSTAIAAFSASADCAHIEYQLHQSIITPMQRIEDEWVADDSIAISGKGWLWFLERVASIVASQFVEQTRFDPQRRAESEQGLYDAIPGLIQSLAEHSEARIEIDGYAARIRAEHLQPVGAAYSDEIARSAPAGLPWLLPTGMSTLPGFNTGTAGAVEINRDWPQKLRAMAGALRQASSELRLQRRLPSGDVTASAPSSATSLSANSASEPPPPSAPTHCLVGNVAQAIVDGLSLSDGTTLHINEGLVTLTADPDHDPRVNDEPASPGQQLAVGDQLTDVTGPLARMILVEN